MKDVFESLRISKDRKTLNIETEGSSLHNKETSQEKADLRHSYNR